MKLQTTRKYMYNLYGADNIYSVGYCNLQYLLNYEQPFGYTCGVYGWNCDLYEVNGLIIAEGYRPIGKGYIDYDLQREYDQKAREIIYNSDTPREDLTELLKEFTDKIKKTEE